MNPARSLLLVLISGAILAQLPPPPAHRPAPPPGPGPGPGPPPPGGSAGVRKKLTEVRPTRAVENKLLALARTYLERSDRIAATNRFASGRDLVAADALVHAAEHQQHIAEQTGPGPPQKDEIARHLERVYFRLQQADYFVKQSADPNAKVLAEFARQYYQDALRAQDRSELRVADECAKSADDVMRALESLAQASVPPPAQPPPPRPPRLP
jgi:hypothetical protein